MAWKKTHFSTSTKNPKQLAETEWISREWMNERERERNGGDIMDSDRTGEGSFRGDGKGMPRKMDGEPGSTIILTPDWKLLMDSWRYRWREEGDGALTHLFWTTGTASPVLQRDGQLWNKLVHELINLMSLLRLSLGVHSRTLNCFNLLVVSYYT